MPKHPNSLPGLISPVLSDVNVVLSYSQEKSIFIFVKNRRRVVMSRRTDNLLIPKI